MIGIVVGGITALVILVFFGKDQKAIRQNKEEKKKAEQERLQLQKKREEERQKYLNDPQVKKQAEERHAKLKERMFKDLSEDDKKLLEDYLQKRRTGNKNDDDVLKQTFLKIGCCILALVLLFAIVFTAILISNDGKEVNIVESVLGALSKIYPRIKEVTTTAQTDL